MLYYAEATNAAEKTNMDLLRFGLRLHWQPPFLRHLVCIAAQAFPKALAATVIRLREKFAPKVDLLQVKGISRGSQPLLLWRNDQLAQMRAMARRQIYSRPR